MGSLEQLFLKVLRDVWLCLAMFGYALAMLWLCFGYAWLCLATFGYAWLCLAVLGCAGLSSHRTPSLKYISTRLLLLQLLA